MKYRCLESLGDCDIVPYAVLVTILERCEAISYDAL